MRLLSTVFGLIRVGLTFDCVASGFKVEISDKDVVKVLKDAAKDEHGRRIAELDLSPRLLKRSREEDAMDKS